MKYEKLYNDCRAALERALTTLWCPENPLPGEPNAQMDEAIRKLTATALADDEAMPVVQCANPYKTVFSVTPEEATALVSDLWEHARPAGAKPFPPYEHQYQCWKTLLQDHTPDGKNLSICVTTGTGSGKTECFMLPLVEDLKKVTKNAKKPAIKAIFLYPLNALMEDQKARLERLLEGTKLTYAVYNGDLPEKEFDETDHSDEAERTRRKIRELRGEEKLPDDTTTYRFPKLCYTREKLRENPPDILLTNPTMLEYILLRQKDKNLLPAPGESALRWIAIDETHSYTGAGAAELALLLRRVCLAFQTTPQELRFATSSATFGNADTPEKRKAEEEALQKFIADITGLAPDQVRVIDGIRQPAIPNNGDASRWQMLYDKEYVPLVQLFPEKKSIPEMLRGLDEMCEQLPQDLPARLKVHFFFRVPNNGLHIRLTDRTGGNFRIYAKALPDLKNADTTQAPMLELCRCRNCGKLLALATTDEKTAEYRATAADEDDMFDLVEETESSKVKTVVLALTNRTAAAKGDNDFCEVTSGEPTKLVSGAPPDPDGWHLAANSHYRCPHCGQLQTSQRRFAENADNDFLDENDMKLQRFRVRPAFVAQTIAPVLLNQMETAQEKDAALLHDGQQFLSFADSRQMAARGTLEQNLQQERLWFYATLFHELCRRKNKGAENLTKIQELKRIRRGLEEEGKNDEADAVDQQIRDLRNATSESMTWSDVAELFRNDEHCRRFCLQFLRKGEESPELTSDGEIGEYELNRYIQSMMVMYLSAHPTTAAAPENLGLWEVVYPKVEGISVLPPEVEEFNHALTKEENRITLADWKCLLRLFLDYVVRQRHSVYLKLGDKDPIDILATRRFQTERPHSRPVLWNLPERGTPSRQRLVRILAGLYGRDHGIAENAQAQKEGFAVITHLLEALWKALTGDGSGDGKAILSHGTTWKDGRHRPDKDRDNTGAWRLNLTEMAFRLPKEVWICDANLAKGAHHAAAWRPQSYLFKGFSPFLADGWMTPVTVDNAHHESWPEPYPFFRGSGRELKDTGTLIQWAEQNRGLLVRMGLWGENGFFSDRLRQIYLYPNLFLQTEHTAQVDKSVARKSQELFRRHAINILACSTTMEMGVDLGSLEAVLLASVPPMPANYKQRAGRSGRRNRIASTCITLCTSDAIGLRTCQNPLENLIRRTVEMPVVDLQSEQVVRRHVNAFLVRAFALFGEGSVTQKVANYYTPYKIRRFNNWDSVHDDHENCDVPPQEKLGSPKGTCYDLFNRCCDPKVFPPESEKALRELLKGTVWEKHSIQEILDSAKADNMRCYQLLDKRAQEFAEILKAGNKPSAGYENYIKWKYVELLKQRLLDFWATNRFTPNANMPVNVLTLELQKIDKSAIYASHANANPSYSLREALTQYAPGNSVVVDGSAYVVRGVDASEHTFLKIYRNQDRVVIGDPAQFPEFVPWEVNGKTDLTLVRPNGFLPDFSENATRLLERNDYTRVSAQLIGASDWNAEANDDTLISVRSNRQDSAEPKILYYNEGKGYGYAYCKCCGRIVLEEKQAQQNDPQNALPEKMNPITPDDNSRSYHMNLREGGTKRCSPEKYDENILRNVILGDQIQTDYCEIRLRRKTTDKWISNRTKERPLLITLGVALTQSLVTALGKAEGAIDFTLTPNGHICLFDTNPGGAGYSCQLATRKELLQNVLRGAKKILDLAKEQGSTDLVLTRNSLRYRKDIDIENALSWLEVVGS